MPAPQGVIPFPLLFYRAAALRRRFLFFFSPHRWLRFSAYSRLHKPHGHRSSILGRPPFRWAGFRLSASARMTRESSALLIFLI